MWDEIDLLLDLLQDDADKTLRELGERIGLSPSAVQRRITRYKEAGLLRTVTVLSVDGRWPLTQALVMLTLAEESPTITHDWPTAFERDPRSSSATRCPGAGTTPYS